MDPTYGFSLKLLYLGLVINSKNNKIYHKDRLLETVRFNIKKIIHQTEFV